MESSTKIIIGSGVGIAMLIAVAIYVKKKSNAGSTSVLGNVDNTGGGMTNNNTTAGSGGGSGSTVGETNGGNATTAAIDAHVPSKWGMTTVISTVMAKPEKDTPTGKVNIGSIVTDPVKLENTDNAIAFREIVDIFNVHGSPNEKNLMAPFQSKYNYAIANNDIPSLVDAVVGAGLLAAQGARNRGFSPVDMPAFNAAKANITNKVDIKNSVETIIRIINSSYK